MILCWEYKNTDLSIDDKEIIKEKIRTRGFKIVGDVIRVSALQQGADSTDENARKYLGDSNVFIDPKAVTIQVSAILPRKDKSPEIMKGKFQFMYSIRLPKAVSVYTKGDN